MKTLKQLAREALDVQDACNLSGVVHGFSRAVTDLRAVLSNPAGIKGVGNFRNPSTDEINAHPICVLWADKIAHLAGIQSLGNGVVGLAYDWAYKEIAP